MHQLQYFPQSVETLEGRLIEFCKKFPSLERLDLPNELAITVPLPFLPELKSLNCYTIPTVKESCPKLEEFHVEYLVLLR